MVLACVGFVIGSAHPASAASQFDGVYSGTQTLIRTDNSANCSASPRTTLTVADGHFQRKWNADLAVDVNADGSFSANAVAQRSYVARAVSIKGQITNGKLEADIGSEYCAAHLSLTRSAPKAN